MQPSKISSARNGLHLFELLVKGVPRKPQTSYPIAKAMGCSPQLDVEAVLLENTYMLSDTKKLGFCLTRSFIPADECSWCGKLLSTLLEEKGNINIS